MPTTCVALNCRQRWAREVRASNLDPRERSFFRFPLQDSELLNKWLTNMKRDEWTPTKASALCSEHFLEKCFRYNNNRRSLVPNAVPTIFKFTALDKRKHRSSQQRAESCSTLELCVTLPELCTTDIELEQCYNHLINDLIVAPELPEQTTLLSRTSAVVPPDHAYALPVSLQKITQMYEEKRNECLTLRQRLKVARQDAARQRVKCLDLKKKLNEAHTLLLSRIPVKKGCGTVAASPDGWHFMV